LQVAQKGGSRIKSGMTIQPQSATLPNRENTSAGQKKGRPEAAFF
jgi:hypothetical protein